MPNGNEEVVTFATLPVGGNITLLVKDVGVRTGNAMYFILYLIISLKTV
jgi:hypothetical protein